MTTLIHARRALTPGTEILDAGILLRDGVIEAIGPRSGMQLPAGAEEIQAENQTAVPGFVDLHIHGAGGHDVMEAGPEALDTLTRAVARHGTTSIVATTVTANPEELLGSIAGISAHIRRQYDRELPRASVLGIHFEGPFLNPLRRGVHPSEFLQLPSLPLLQKMLEAASGTARILTLAPELEGAAQCLEAARKAGVVISMGHTDATYEQAREAIARGARHAAHVYNAMRPFSHRDSGVIGAVLTSPEVTAELIADLVHVDQTAMKLLLQAKGAGGVILVSDGISATGMPDGKYRLGQLEVTVSGGICRNREGRLAGSTLTLDRALRNVVALGLSLGDALRMLTLNPATLLGAEFKKGTLRIGADADLVLLSEDLQVSRVWTRGRTLP